MSIYYVPCPRLQEFSSEWDEQDLPLHGAYIPVCQMSNASSGQHRKYMGVEDDTDAEYSGQERSCAWGWNDEVESGDSDISSGNGK